VTAFSEVGAVLATVIGGFKRYHIKALIEGTGLVRNEVDGRSIGQQTKGSLPFKSEDNDD